MKTNLLRGEWTLAQLREILSRHPPKPLLPILGSVPWQDARKKRTVEILVAPLRIKAESEVNEPLPILTDDLYADIGRTGQRLRFETP